MCCVLFLRPVKQCSLGLQHRECISCCPESCNLERTCIDSKLACLDGCYCPDGECLLRFCFLCSYSKQFLFLQFVLCYDLNLNLIRIKKYCYYIAYTLLLTHYLHFLSYQSCDFFPAPDDLKSESESLISVPRSNI